MRWQVVIAREGIARQEVVHRLVELDAHRRVLMIDMLDVLREKTMGNLAPEEDSLLLDVLGNLKLAFMEMAKAAAQHEKAKSQP
jgi:hypothetical protein